MPKIACLKNQKPDIRYLNDMKEVLYDKKLVQTAKNIPLYYMYRGLKEKNNLRYDITIMPSQMLGKEFVKTKGHKHRGHFQELYIVLKGKAIYLMQKGKDKIIEDVFFVSAKKGEAVIIPSNYAHVTINFSSTELKMANWISKKCKSDYKQFEKTEGACYYYTESGWIKNKNYVKIPKLRSKKPLRSIPQNLDFLK